jgi:hypothetical protein
MGAMTFAGLDLPWNEPDSSLLGKLADHGASAAHIPVLDAETGAQRTYIAVRAALRMLLANGLITAVPEEDWPEYVVVDAPAGAETPA